MSQEPTSQPTTDELAQLGLLAAGLFHELSTPLSFVSLNLGIVQNEIPESAPESVRRALEQAEEGCNRIRDLSRDFRAALGHCAPNPGKCVIERVISSALNLTSPQILPRAQIELELGATGEAMISESRLSQVLINLLINAAQSIMPASEKRNIIRIRTYNKDAHFFGIEISDTGMGIEKENLDRIFQPFYTTKRAAGGSGLGLSLSSKIIESCGGQITATSTLGEGSIFTVFLRRADLP